MPPFHAGWYLRTQTQTQIALDTPFPQAGCTRTENRIDAATSFCTGNGQTGLIFFSTHLQNSTWALLPLSDATSVVACQKFCDSPCTVVQVTLENKLTESTVQASELVQTPLSPCFVPPPPPLLPSPIKALDYYFIHHKLESGLPTHTAYSCVSDSSSSIIIPFYPLNAIESGPVSTIPICHVVVKYQSWIHKMVWKKLLKAI